VRIRSKGTKIGRAVKIQRKGKGVCDANICPPMIIKLTWTDSV